MKKKLLICCLLACFVCKAQHPSPRNFYHSIGYIALDEREYCNGTLVGGAEYCTHFYWEAPDIPDGDALPTGYNVYCYDTEEYEEGMEIPLSEVVLIVHTTNTNLELKGACTGVVWVTALYSDGESEPSNISVYVEGLPIDVKSVISEKIILNYNQQSGSIEIKGIENVTSIIVFRPDGTKMIFASPVDNGFISAKKIEKGVYIVQVRTKDFQVISKKIVIE